MTLPAERRIPLHRLLRPDPQPLLMSGLAFLLCREQRLSSAEEGTGSIALLLVGVVLSHETTIWLHGNAGALRRAWQQGAAAQQLHRLTAIRTMAVATLGWLAGQIVGGCLDLARGCEAFGPRWSELGIALVLSLSVAGLAGRPLAELLMAAPPGPAEN